MRIAVLAHLHHPIRQPYLGGLEAHTAELCEELARRGHRVTLFAKEGSLVRLPAQGPGTVELVPVLPAAFVWQPGSSQGDDERLDEASRQACARAAGHDVVINNCLNPVPYRALPDQAMLTILHTPATLERVAAVVRAPGWRPGPRHAWVSVSGVNAVGWRELLRGVPVGVVPNGIDLEAWPATTDAGGRLAWSARITPEKGLHVAIDAALATGRGLDIAGPVSDRGYFDEQIAPRLAAAAGRVRHLGHLTHPELAALIGQAAAFLCTPLWEEPFGLAPLEAMACGTPVAALRRGALPGLLGADGGVLAETARELPDAIRRAVTLDRAAVRRRAERYGRSGMVDEYLRILGALREGRQPFAAPRR